jgi:tetratricopeptide (TPR) repeat protein/O-antigen ligase
VNQRQSVLESIYRGAICAYLFVLVLAMYTGTGDPTMDIKYVLSTWTAAFLTGSFVLITWAAGIPLRRTAIFRDVLLCLLAFLFLASLFSEFRAISFLETGRFFALFALYWLVSQVYRNAAQVARLFVVLSIAVSLASLYAMMQWAGLDPFPWDDRTSDTYTNLPATFGNPNFAAHALILVIIVIVGLWRMGQRWTLFLLPLLALHLFKTDQRAGWIAMGGAAVLVGIAWVFLRRSRRPVMEVSAAVGAFTLLGAGAVIGAMYIFHARTGHAFPLDLSLLLRYQSYVSATDMLLDAPVLGHGPGVYGLAYAPYWTSFEQDWFAQELRLNGHVHNDLIELAIDGGLAAAGLYLATLLLGICYGLLLAVKGESPDQRRLGFVFAALFTAFGIDGLFGFNLRVPVTAAVLFISMGLLEGLWSPEEGPKRSRFVWLSPVTRLAFVIVLGFAGRLEYQAFTGEYHFQAGLLAQERGDLEEARKACQRAEAAAPWHWHAPRRIGISYLDEGNARESRPHLLRALEKNPYYLLTRLPMARASLMLAQDALRKGAGGVAETTEYLDEARTHAYAMLDTAPNFSQGDELLGRVESIAAILERDFSPEPDIEAQEDHWKAARDHFKRAIDNGSENTGRLYRLLMRVEIGLGNRVGAERAILGAVQVGGENAGRAWKLFLDLARETEDFGGMRDALYRQIDDLRHVIAKEEGEVGSEALSIAFDWLAAVQIEGFEDFESALDAHRLAAMHGPQRPDTWSRLAAFAYAHNRIDVLEETVTNSCEELAAAGISPLPQVEAVHMLLGRNADGLNTASARLLLAIRSHSPSASLNAKDSYGWTVRLLLDNYRKAEQSGSASCESALNLGIAAKGIQEFGVADNLFEQAVDCLEGEGKSAAVVHWSDMMLLTGKAPQALTLLESTNEEFPDHLDIRWAMARTLARLGRLSEARALYEALIDTAGLAPDSRKKLRQELDTLPPG